ncbi:lipase chaperone [Undibacterium sp. Jales W-56]|uniref:lipase secretion chaperone n=1 Tax=Undibacterium sp. Jales W-56 TaxID=2897325 RepID=UPI0021D2FFC7|nr:lipase secretion chaperone [Undibacterium sp. Jales W-56]MCU6434753.1 lipase chaperone [Undibacterium sp. Jales W-56]
MTIKKRSAFFAVTAAVLVTAAFFILRPPQNNEIAADQNGDKDPFAFVRSMEGTLPDGQVQQTDADTLIVDNALRRLFDYYLAAIGEKSLNEIRTEIEKELDGKLSKNAAIQAKNLLGRYLDYKRELAEIEKKPLPSSGAQEQNPATAAIKARLTIMQQTRQRYFSEKENQAFFAFDDAYDSDAIARLEISDDKRLNEAQKQQRLQALDAAMPAGLRAEKEAPYQVLRLEENVAKMRAQGASDDQIYRMRAAATTPEAAARLADLDREDAQWKTRIANYLTQRSRVLSDTANRSTAEQIAALQQIRNQMFDANEQKRLAAYE